MHSLALLLEMSYNGREQEMPKRLLCLDPGNTTGWCTFVNGVLDDWGQVDTCEDAGGNNGASCVIDWWAIDKLCRTVEPTCIVVENYRVYSHKLERHTFSEIPTLRLIGGIDFIAARNQTPVVYQMATEAKTFVTDDKLKAWGLWKEGQRHSRDAIRHGIYYLLVRNRKKESK